MRQPARPDDADTDLRLCYTGPSPAREWQEAFERAVRAAGRLRLRDVGVAVRADLAARHAAVRHARLGPPAPDAGRRQRGPGRRRGRRATSGAGETGELLLRNPTVTPGLLGDAGGDRGGDRRRLAAHRRPGDGQRRRAPTRSSRARRRCCAGAARTSRRPRSRTRSPAHPDVLEVAVVGVPSELTEDEVKAFVVAGAGRSAGLRRAARVDRRSGCRRSRCRASGRPSTRCRARRPPGSPSTGCRPATRRGVRRRGPHDLRSRAG